QARKSAIGQHEAPPSAPFLFPKQVNMQTRPPLPRTVRLSELSPPRQMLVRLCQAINFGSLHRLTILDREPIFSLPPIVILELKLDSDDERRPEVDLDDFQVRDEFHRLLNRIDLFRNGMIERIEVRAGIPRRLFFQTIGAVVLR